METKKLEVLVVEDTQKHIEGAKQLLKDYNVTIVSTYIEATEEIASKQYDIVLTDLFMPWYTKTRYPIESRDKLQEILTPQALGYPLAMVALAAGVQYVGIVTDANHHDGPMSATTDDLTSRFYRTTKIVGNQGEKPQLYLFTEERKPWDFVIKVLLGQVNIKTTTPLEYKEMLKKRMK